MSKVYQDSHSYANLLVIVSALKWLHSFLPQLYKNPFDSPICKNFLEAAKHCKAPIKRKVPITPEMIKAIIDKSYLIPDVEKSCKTASRRLDTTTKITVCTVYFQAERPQQCKIITTCQKGHLNCTDGGNQIQQKICTFWKKFHNALRLLTI